MAGGSPAAPLAEERRLLALLRRRRSGRESAGAEVERAAEALLECTYRQTYAVLFRLCGGDRELAADLTQETYRKAWAALGSFDGRARFATWLYRIAYTTFLNHARRPRLFVPLAGERDDDPPGAAPAAAGDSAWSDPGPPADAMLAAERGRARLRRAVLALPEDLRYTVTARFWGEQPVAEIARQQGVTGVAVRKRLRKAFALLAVQLEEETP